MPARVGRFLLVALATLALAACEKDTRDTDIVNVKLAEVSEVWQDAKGNPLAVLFIDPRPQPQFEDEHIPGARNLLLTRFDGDKGRDPRITQFRQIIVYGDDPSSPIARAVVKRMLAMDYDEVRLFSGGLKEWKAANLPTERGPSAPLPNARTNTSRGRAR